MNSDSSVLECLMNGKDLESNEAMEVMQEIVDGKLTPATTAALLTALQIKGVNAEELSAFARTLRKNAVPVHAGTQSLLDTCGTGGDQTGTFNISTAAAFVAAGAGARIAKHGNRAASGKTGSTDVLEKLGIRPATTPTEALEQLKTAQITFLSAPAFHPGLRHVHKVRKELGFKTVFNLLGPLINPFSPQRQLIGIYSPQILEKMALAIQNLGTEKTVLVSSDTDEISLSAPTSVCEIRGQHITVYSITPEEFGFKRQKPVMAKDADESAKIILKILEGNPGPARDTVLLNAGAAIYANGQAASIRQGMTLAVQSIDSEKAIQKLQSLRELHGHP
ncbi:MAG: anthranilate phosphoribosyltransferase [Candidatus Diapherotrites archaeon]|nr:anthranilate phosphoribosyltransferase [Candidatus Diapherotrites archaeon]